MAQWLLIKQVQVSYVNDLGPRSRNDLDLNHSHIFINSFSFRSQAAIVSENSTFFYLFLLEKLKVPNLTLPKKWVKVSSGSSFEQTMMGRISQCYIPSFVAIGLLVPEKKILKGFTICRHGCHLCHVISIILINFISMYIKAYIQNLVRNGPLVSEKSKF